MSSLLLPPHPHPPTIAKSRNSDLDCLKGFAILLVVAGHWYQNSSTDYDLLWGMRLIYAFHMPLFMMLSGAALAFGFARSFDVAPKDFAQSQARALFKRGLRLLLPFFAWAYVHYYYINLQERQSLIDYTLELLRHWDIGLWFLVAVFWLSLMVQLAEIGLYSQRSFYQKSLGRRVILDGLALYLAFELMCRLKGIGSTVNAYGIYFCFGFMVQRYGTTLKAWFIASPYVRLLPLFITALFALMVCTLPFWYRTGPSLIPLWLEQHTGHAFESAYIFITAVSTSIALSLVVLRLVRFMRPLRIFLTFLGLHTLEIYALHGYLFPYLPKAVIMSVLCVACVSAVIGLLLRTLPLICWAFTGQGRQSPLNTLRLCFST